MSDSCFGGVVWSLWLRNVDYGSRHAADHDNASRCLPLHEMLRDSDRVQVGTVDIDSPKLLYAVMRVRDGVVVLGEASRCNKVIDLAVLLQNLSKGLVDRRRTRDIAEMCCNLGDSVSRVSPSRVVAHNALTSWIQDSPS